MDERRIKQEFTSLRRAEDQAPSFEGTWDAASDRMKSRRRIHTAIQLTSAAMILIALGVTVVVVNHKPEQHDASAYIDMAHSLTAWRSPTSILLRSVGTKPQSVAWSLQISVWDAGGGSWQPPTGLLLDPLQRAQRNGRTLLN